MMDVVLFWIGFIIFIIGTILLFIEDVKTITEKKNTNKIFLALIVMNVGNLIVQISSFIEKLGGGN